MWYISINGQRIGPLERAAAAAQARAHPAALCWGPDSAEWLLATQIPELFVEIPETPKIPNYTLLSKLGEGAMADVWLAEHQINKRKAAIKILKPVRDASAEQLFVREGQVLASFDHPSIVRILEQGRVGKLCYLVMECLAGGTLEDRMDRKKSPPVTVGEALGLVVQIAGGLGEAHQQQVVHRDLKPANIMLRNDTTPVLTDFGFARFTNRSMSMHAQAGMVVGTPDYMSPEQWTAQALDGRTDLYALGILFFKLLTGQLPFPGGSFAEIGGQHLHAPLPQLPAELAVLQPVLAQLLAKKKEDRYPTAQDFIDALRSCFLNEIALRRQVGFAATSRAWSSQLRALGFVMDSPQLVDVRIAQGEAEAARLAEEKRLAEVARSAEAERQTEAAEAARRAEDKRQAEEAEAKRIAEQKRQAEVTRIAEAKRRAEEAEVARITEEKRQAEAVQEAKRQIEAARPRPSSKVPIWLAGGVALVLAVGWNWPRPEPKPAPPAVQAPTETPKPTEIAARTPGTVFHDQLKDGSEAPDMVVIPAGSFLMGSPASEADRSDDEGPQHRVSVPAFAMGKTEVTVAQFRKFAEATNFQAATDCDWKAPGFTQADSHPVVCISFDDAEAYAKWLAKETGKRYRLPSEAQFEYALRAGTSARYAWGKDVDSACAHANVSDQALKAEPEFKDWLAVNCKDGYAYTSPVGSFQANAFGLEDMVGNAWEWTADCWNDSYAGAPSDGSAWAAGDCSRRVLRGAGCSTPPVGLRAASRCRDARADRSSDTGLRLIQDL